MSESDIQCKGGVQMQVCPICFKIPEECVHDRTQWIEEIIDVDNLILDTVRILNDKGYPTRSSCSGHAEDGDKKNIFIIFRGVEKEIAALAGGSPFSVRKDEFISYVPEEIRNLPAGDPRVLNAIEENNKRVKEWVKALPRHQNAEANQRISLRLQKKDTEPIPELLTDIFNGEINRPSIRIPDFSQCKNEEQRYKLIGQMHREILDYDLREQSTRDEYAKTLIKMQDEQGFIKLPAFGKTVPLSSYGIDDNEVAWEMETYISQFLPTWLATAFLLKHYLAVDMENRNPWLWDAILKGLDASVKTPFSGWEGFVHKGKLLAYKVFVDGDIMRLRYEDYHTAIKILKEFDEILAYVMNFPSALIRICATSENEEGVLWDTIEEIESINNQTGELMLRGLSFFGVLGEFREGGKYHHLLQGSRYYCRGRLWEAGTDPITGLIKNHPNTDKTVEFDIHLVPDEQIEVITSFFEDNQLGHIYSKETELYPDNENTYTCCYLAFAPRELSGEEMHK